MQSIAMQLIKKITILSILFAIKYFLSVHFYLSRFAEADTFKLYFLFCQLKLHQKLAESIQF